MNQIINVGLIDDEKTNYEDYATRLKRKCVNLIFYDGNNSIDNIVEWLIENEILCVLVDYDLRKKFAHNGTDLVFQLNQILPNFPCIMLTNYPEQSKDEKLVARRLIWDREELNALDLSDIIDTIKNEIEVFLKRKETLLKKYETLVQKRKNNQLSSSEEETLVQLHSIFSKYGETDDIPSQLLSFETNKKLDSLIDHLSKLIDKKEE